MAKKRSYSWEVMMDILLILEHHTFSSTAIREGSRFSKDAVENALYGMANEPEENRLIAVAIPRGKHTDTYWRITQKGQKQLDEWREIQEQNREFIEANSYITGILLPGFTFETRDKRGLKTYYKITPTSEVFISYDNHNYTFRLMEMSQERDQYYTDDDGDDGFKLKFLSEIRIHKENLIKIGGAASYSKFMDEYLPHLLIEDLKEAKAVNRKLDAELRRLKHKNHNGGL